MNVEEIPSNPSLVLLWSWSHYVQKVVEKDGFSRISFLVMR